MKLDSAAFKGCAGIEKLAVLLCCCAKALFAAQAKLAVRTVVEKRNIATRRRMPVLPDVLTLKQLF